MTAKSGVWIGILLIVSTLGLLFFIPRAFHRKSYSIALEQSAAKKKISLEHSLLLLGTPKATHKKLADFFTSGKKMLLVNFWATWCPPCIDELPSLEHLAKQLEKNSQPIRVVTICADEKQEDIHRLKTTLPFSLTLPILWDSKGDEAILFGTSRFPESYLIDREGTVLYKWIGPQDWLSADVLGLLAEAGHQK